MNATNSSTSNAPATSSQALARLSLLGFIAIFGFCLTSCVLLTYATDRGLSKNIFHIYVQNLLMADWFYFALFLPFFLLTTTDYTRVYPSWICALNDYVNYVTVGLPPVAHVLISLNRLWAIAFPHSYRKRRSGKTAFGHCVVGVIFFHVIGVPPVVIECIRYSENRGPGCPFDLNDQSIAIFMFIGTAATIACEAVVLGLYPFVWWKNKVRQRARVALTSKPGGPQTQLTDDAASGGANTNDKVLEIQERKAAPREFNALSALTLTVFLFWTPLYIYVAVFSVSDKYFDADVWAWMNVLATIQTLCDPLIFLISLKDLRSSFMNLIRFSACKWQ